MRGYTGEWRTGTNVDPARQLRLPLPAMILTPIPRDRLDAALDRFAAQLDDPAARAAFARIRATAPERAEGAAAESHRQQALALARRCGMAIYPAGSRPGFNWDGIALDGDTEAYVILHEIAHFVLAPPERRRLADFGLGPGPDTTARTTAEDAAILPIHERDADEAAASLLGILWEAALGQPALASFLDQNWLEGLERSAAPHFTEVLRRLRRLASDPTGGHGLLAGVVSLPTLLEVAKCD
jgi:hypothetical protein